MADSAYARKLAAGKRISDLMADDAFVGTLPRTDSGEYSLIIGDWEDTMADVFKHIDLVEVPAVLLVSRGDSFLEFTLRMTADKTRVATYDYDPHTSLRDFLVHVMIHGGVSLNFPSPEELPAPRQLFLDLERVA